MKMELFEEWLKQRPEWYQWSNQGGKLPVYKKDIPWHKEEKDPLNPPNKNSIGLETELLGSVGRE
jgi:hypothetical protein